ncbi:MAG: DUF4097 family beta strand repeat protein [Lachnospiraceae bacterium]|nr:DUF4097 family beta strand repeat protein [Lachnospiraceae bacterium]
MFKVIVILFAFITILGATCEKASAKEVDLKDGVAVFTDIKKIEADITDVPITIMESDVEEITVTSTVENTGIGIVTQPKVREKGNVLHFHQGYMIGYATESTGVVTIEIPEGMNVDIDITSGSGDVTIDTSASNNISIDASVGEKTVTSKGENLVIESVSGDINIYGGFTNTKIDTVNSDVKMHADADTEKIYYKSVSGDADICADGVKGCNLKYKYAGGKADEFFEMEEDSKKTFDVEGDTVDGRINIVNCDDNCDDFSQ